MTTFSDRILLRWAPISTLLAAGTTVGLSVGPHPYGYHSWPRPAVERPIESLVPAPASQEHAIVADGPLNARHRLGSGAPASLVLASARLPSTPARAAGRTGPAGPSHPPPAVPAPQSSPRSGTPQAGGVDGHRGPATGNSNGAPSGSGTTPTKGDGNGSGRPAIAAKVKVDDLHVTAASHSGGCDHGGDDTVTAAPAVDATPPAQTEPPAAPVPATQPPSGD